MASDDLSTGEETLRDGRVVRIRPLCGDDARGVEAFWRRLGARDRHLFLSLAHLSTEDPGAVALAHPGTAGIVAVAPDSSERLAGVARYELRGADAAQFMVFVDSSYRRAGLGTVLIGRLADAARHAGVRRLVGDVPARDAAMRALLHQLGLDDDERVTGERVRASFAVQETDAYLDALVADQRAAARAALDSFLAPRSIAVVGASDDRTSIGGLLFANLRASGYDGDLFPVNPNHDVIQGVPSVADLAECARRPDLAVVAVPAPLVAGIVDQAGELGVHALCVISAGFAEVGPAGRALQGDVRSHARAGGVRLIGPNCMGVLNGGPETRFNATFSPVFPPPGRVAFVSQSGGLGLAALALLDSPALGVSGFVSVGNTADLSANDLLLYWGDDPRTDVILAYLESVADPRRFARIARRVSRRKPIVVVKSGRTSAGRRAASSHTAALAAGDQVVEALFRQAGVIRVNALEEMFDVAAVLTSRSSTSGRRVAVLTNGGGPGILVADACEAAGLLVPELSGPTRDALGADLPPEASLANPVDIVSSATAEQYGRSLRLLGAADEVDAIIVVFIPPFLTRAEDVAREIVAAARDLAPTKPVLGVFMMSDPPVRALADAGIPVFAYPEQAATALGRVARWSEWRDRPAGQVVTPSGIDPRRARVSIDAALRDQPDGGWLDAATALELLAAYGVTSVRSRIVRTPEEASAAQAEWGVPVVVKVAAAIHKSDVGGVALGIESPDAAADAVRSIREALTRAGAGEHAGAFLVQEQIGDGVEMIVGVNHDPAFGPVVMAGWGGTLVEIVADVAVRLTPLSDLDADEMIRSLRSYPLLTGYRNAAPLDVAAFADLLLRVSAMVEDVPEIAELDFNPVFVRRSGVAVVDVRVRVAP